MQVNSTDNLVKQNRLSDNGDASILIDGDESN